MIIKYFLLLTASTFVFSSYDLQTPIKFLKNLAPTEVKQQVASKGWAETR